MTSPLPVVLISLVLVGFGAAPPPEKDSRLIGRIESIPQVSPLQLKVKLRDGSRLIQCADDTAVVRGKQKANRGELKPDQHVIVSGRANGEQFVASKIELVDLVEGKIDAIMEIFPLRLAVKTKKGNVHIQLEKETRVVRKNADIDPGQLRNGDSVRVYANSSGELLIAKQIEVDSAE